LVLRRSLKKVEFNKKYSNTSFAFRPDHIGAEGKTFNLKGMKDG